MIDMAPNKPFLVLDNPTPQSGNNLGGGLQAARGVIRFTGLLPAS